MVSPDSHHRPHNQMQRSWNVTQVDHQIQVLGIRKLFKFVMWLFSLLGILLAVILHYSVSQRFHHCASEKSDPSRVLYVATCDTRSHWKEFQAMKVWNVTGAILRSQGLQMVNVCKGHNWGAHGFLTKPILYHQFISSLPREQVASGKAHVIIMDSDTFWSSNNIDDVWNRYDCARKGKDIIVSTEMSCWVGRYCKEEDLKRWYSDSSIVPSYSPFLNSGVIMGVASSVSDMLDYVIRNNQSYFITYVKHKFDDQYAIADYSINVAPQKVTLDYHQQLAASCSIHTVGPSPDTGWPFVCKHRNGSYYPSCLDFTTKLQRSQHFRIDDKTCMAYRYVNNKLPEHEELETIAPFPVIWHGNGAGKRVFLSLAHNTFHCHLKKMNMTEKDHWNTFG